MGTNEMEEEKKYRKTEIPEHIKPRLAEVYFKFGMELDFYRKNAGLKMKEVGLRLGWGEARSKSIIPTIIGAKDPVKFATLMEVASLFGKTLEIKWVDIGAGGFVQRHQAGGVRPMWRALSWQREGPG